MDYEFYDRLIDKDGIGRYDTTPILGDDEAFARLIEDLARSFQDADITKVVGLEALGFALAAPVAARLRAGFVPLRKGGRLPLAAEKKRARSFVDYTDTEKSFEIRADALDANDRVLIVDDWIETGAQVRAAIRMIEDLGATVAGVSVLAAERTTRTNDLFERYDVRAMRVFDKR